MAAAVGLEASPDDVGQILVQVQEDLQQLKTKLLSQANAGQNKPIDITYLENAIRKTEKTLKARTEEALNHINNRVTTLPDFEDHGQPRNDNFVSTETLWQIHPSPVAGKLVSEISRPQEKSLFLTEGSQVSGLTPGQQFQQAYNAKLIANPQNARNREVMNNAYKVQLPLINERKSAKPASSEISKGSTVVRLAVLPQANRLDQQYIQLIEVIVKVVLPGPEETDAKKGILSLIDRGFIPPGAQLVLEPPPIKQSLVPIYRGQARQKVPLKDSNKMAVVKYEPGNASNSDPLIPARPKSARDVESRTSANPPRRMLSMKSQSQSAKARTAVPIRLMEISSGQPQPPPTTPSSMADHSNKQHRFVCQHGKAKEKSEEFLAFKQHYCHLWGCIATMLKYLEKMLRQYSVPIAFISGDKLVDISFEFELEQRPTINDLLEVVVNRDEVEKLIRKPGNRFKGAKGRDLAAAKIQATYRMYRQRREYVDYRRKKWAAGVLAMSWIMCVKIAQVRKQLKARRMDQLESFKARSKYLSANWRRIKQSKRVVIHIPSLGYSENLRQTINQLDMEQNLQMSRLCDLRDPNVDVIYVSPVDVTDELTQYYGRLIGLKPAIDSGNSDDQSDLSERYKMIVPEAMKSFPNHRMCLSSRLKYSPRSLKRIKNLIRGREAYIVTGMPHTDDLFIADYLGIGILGPEPDLAHLYSTKSGSKRIFNSANVKMPPGEFDIYSLQQLYEALTQLIIDNIEVSRWLLKIDDEFEGRGIACLDVAQNLKCYNWVAKEAERYGDKWNKKWAQESSYLKIFNEMPQFSAEFAQPVNRSIYPSWDSYLKAFLSRGGVIEACPPSDSITTLSVNMLIEPDGVISLVSSGDQIHAESEFRVWGFSTPQSSVEAAMLNEACFKIAESCKGRGIVGYFTIDFVTFIDPYTMKQELWATDLDLKYSDMVSMHQLLEFMTGGSFDPHSHLFSVPPPKQEEKKKRRRGAAEIERPKSVNRYGVMSTQLHHSNMMLILFSVFFQMCRAHNIGYDIKEKRGTVFTMVDNTRRENLGMITIGETLQGALASFASNLSVIHQEISSPKLQGKSNFRAAILDIEAILGMTIENAESQKEGDETKK